MQLAVIFLDTSVCKLTWRLYKITAYKKVTQKSLIKRDCSSSSWILPYWVRTFRAESRYPSTSQQSITFGVHAAAKDHV